jgi:hypothetical protein
MAYSAEDNTVTVGIPSGGALRTRSNSCCVIPRQAAVCW